MQNVLGFGISDGPHELAQFEEVSLDKGDPGELVKAVGGRGILIEAENLVAFADELGTDKITEVAAATGY
jgi:hypothetical protein